MNQQWYVRIGPKLFGPHSLSKLQKGAKTGKLSPHTLVREGESGTWMEASNIPGLFNTPLSPNSSDTEPKQYDGWYYQSMGETFGPIAAEALTDLSRNGIISRETNIRFVEGGKDHGWTAAGTMPGLDEYFSMTPTAELKETAVLESLKVVRPVDSSSPRPLVDLNAIRDLLFWFGGLCLVLAGLLTFSGLRTLPAAPFFFAAAFVVVPRGWSFLTGRWPTIFGSGPRIATTFRCFCVLLPFVVLGKITERRDAVPVYEPTVSATKPKAPPPAEEKTIPASSPPAASQSPLQFKLSVINEEVLLDQKRSLDIQLEEAVSEDELRSIAKWLKASDLKSYNRTFICFYLPGMQVGAGAWATTHFTPDLEVRILGPATEALAGSSAKERTNDRSAGVVGRWLDPRPFMGGITIFRQKASLILETRFTDGSTNQKVVVEKPDPFGRRFDPVIDTAGTGDHYVLDLLGDLQIRDREGLIATAKKRE